MDNMCLGYTAMTIYMDFRFSITTGTKGIALCRWLYVIPDDVIKVRNVRNIKKKRINGQ